MHVLWINEVADFVGGCEQYIHNTVQLLSKHGAQSSLLYDCRQPSYSTGFANAFDRAFPLVNVNDQIAEINPDVIYLHRFFDREIIAAVCDNRVPSVRFIHDYRLLCLREHKYKPIGLKTCDQTIGWRCYPCLGFINKTQHFPGVRLNRVGSFRSALAVDQRMDMTIAGSDHMLNHLLAHGFDPQRTHRLYPYSNPPKPQGHPACEEDLLLFVGQLHTGKGLDILLNAIALTKKPVRLAVVGTGPQADQLKALAVSLGIGERVYFEGWQPSEEISRYYERASCVVVPSRFPEPFCMIGTESMSYARPVIGTDVGAISEWLADGVTGTLVPPNDPSAMANAIDNMMDNPERAKEMGEAGQTRYQEKFIPELHRERLLELFQGLIERSSAHA